MKRILFFLAVILLTSSAWGGSGFSNFKDGDIIFHTSRSAQSVAIQRATRSPYSHCGIIFYRNSKPYVYEAVSTVKFTPLDKWVARGDGGRFVVQRLKNPSVLESKSSVEKLRKATDRFRGKPYDLTFEWSDQRIYCSELVWKLYDRALGIQVGELQKLKEFNLSDPVVSKKMKERYGSNVPLEEPVISPAAIFESDKLMTVSR